MPVSFSSFATVGKSAAFAKKSGLGGELGVMTLAGLACRWPQTVALGEVGIALFQKGCQHYSENLNTVIFFNIFFFFSVVKVSVAVSAGILNFSPAKGHLEVFCEQRRKASVTCMTSVPKSLV